MWINVSVPELALVGLLLAATAVSWPIHRFIARWLAVAAASMLAAAVFTPADPLSTIAAGLALLGSFALGAFWGPALGACSSGQA